MILDWKIVAENIYEDLKLEVSKIDNKPKWVVVLVWNNPASLRYVSQKEKWAKYIWVDFEVLKLDENISTSELIKEVEKLNNDDQITWFIIQLPLPKHIDENEVISKINPKKDIDWFHIENLWKIMIWDNSWLTPCTPSGIIDLIDYYQIDLTGKNVVMIWRSNIVWKPLANMLINRNATVTVCHSKTRDISYYTKNADIVIVAVWIAKFLKAEMLKKDSLIIDVGFSVIDWIIYWDADYDNILKAGHSITPVPGWVWPLTVANLMKNLVKCIK